MAIKELALRQGERLLMSGGANKWSTVGSKGGHLFLTDQRVVFRAHKFNFNSRVYEYELSDIQTRGNTVNIKTSSNLISFNIEFYTKSGEKLSFVVTRRQKNEWIEQITKAITTLARSKVIVPENIPQEEVNNSCNQIKAIQCVGCGAFVIVTEGVVSKCDYCGRPAVE